MTIYEEIEKMLLTLSSSRDTYIDETLREQILTDIYLTKAAQAFISLLDREITAAYTKGYNTGWQKAKRLRVDTKLPKIITMLEATLVETKKLADAHTSTSKETDEGMK